MDSAGWSVLRTMVAEGCKPPAPRGGHTATLVDKNILIQGGQQHKSSGTFEYFSLNPVVLNTETHTWFEPRVSLGKGPQNRAYHTTTRIGGNLLVFGGSTSGFKKGGPVLLGDLPVFDLVRMAWELRDIRGRQPRPRNMHSAALMAGKLFIVGGFDGVQSLGDVHVLDTETMLWSQPRCDGKVPPSLQAHACALVGDRLLLLGGCTVHIDDKGHTYSHSNHETFLLHTETMMWERLRKRGQQPVGRSFAAAAIVENFLVLLGGWSGKCENVAELATLDLNGSGSWAVVTVPGQAPAGVYGHTATVIGTNIVVFGGWDGISPMNAVNVLDTSLL